VLESEMLDSVADTGDLSGELVVASPVSLFISASPVRWLRTTP